MHNALKNCTPLPADLWRGCYDCLVKGDCRQNWLERTEHFPHCRVDSHILTSNKTRKLYNAFSAVNSSIQLNRVPKS